MKYRKEDAGKHILFPWAEIRLAAAGFLLSRGLSGAALCAGWSMTAIAGRPEGSVFTALLFAAECSAVILVMNGFPPLARAAAQWLTAAAYILWQMTSHAPASPLSALMDSLSVMLSLLLLRRRKMTVADLVLLAAMTAVRLSPPLNLEAEIRLRIQALCCGLACAGMCGFALSRLDRTDSAPLWLIAGAAAGLI